MDLLFNYGNLIFWIGLLIVIFLAGCEFCFNNMNVNIAKYKTFTFVGRPRLQKLCRTLFVVTLVMALFAKSGANWQMQTAADYFTNLMVVLLIYYVVCYSVTICLMWMAYAFLKILRLAIGIIIWLCYDTLNWINEK